MTLSSSSQTPLMTTMVITSQVQAEVTFRHHFRHGIPKQRKKFLDHFISDLNSNLLAGRDKEPNLSLSSKRPAMYSALRTGAIEKAVFVGGSNARNLAYSASALSPDAYQLTNGGWKLSKENVDKILPDLKDLLSTHLTS
jgi:hypothetical protein